MEKIKKSLCGGILTLSLLIQPSVYAEHAEFELDNIYVTANREDDIFKAGNATIVTRDEIERRHFSNVKEALRHIPGVSVLSSGYRASAANEHYAVDAVRLNGDERVVILVDGRRVGNDNQGTGTGRSKVVLDQLVNIDNVEKIEVLKGAGAAIYGNDAVGGVINIITRKGLKNKTTIDMSAGSWGKRDYKIVHSGTENDIRYIFTAGKAEGDDTSYRDAELNKVIKYKNTSYDDKHVTLRVDKKIDDNRSLSIKYSYLNNNDKFPISALDYINPIGIIRNPDPTKGLAAESQAKGDNVRTIGNEFDITYNFRGPEKEDNFLRVYRNYNHCRENSQAWGGWVYDDISRVFGSELRLGEKINANNLVTYGVEWRKSDYISNQIEYSYGNTYNSYYRTYLGLFAQDQIQMAKKWTVVPGLRYSQYGNVENNGKRVAASLKEGTASLFTNYELSKNTNMYASWQQLFNAPYNKDYNLNPSVKPEKGDSYSIGLNHKINEKTTVRTSYFDADVDNAIVRYKDVKDINKPGKWNTVIKNVDQKKKAFEVQVAHKFDNAWSINTSYAYNATKQDDSLNPDDGSTDATYKKIYPVNLYKLDLNYQQQKWDMNIVGQYYSGCDTQAFTASSFLIWDFGLNYKFDKNKKAYFKVQNVTDKAYETRAFTDTRFGIGAFPMPSRNFVLGFTQSI